MLHAGRASGRPSCRRDAASLATRLPLFTQFTSSSDLAVGIDVHPLQLLGPLEPERLRPIAAVPGLPLDGLAFELERDVDREVTPPPRRRATTDVAYTVFFAFSASASCLRASSVVTVLRPPAPVEHAAAAPALRAMLADPMS